MTSSKTTSFGYVAIRIAVGQTKHFRLQGCLGIYVVLLRDSFVAKEWNRDGWSHDPFQSAGLIAGVLKRKVCVFYSSVAADRIIHGSFPESPFSHFKLVWLNHYYPPDRVFKTRSRSRWNVHGHCFALVVIILQCNWILISRLASP